MKTKVALVGAIILIIGLYTGIINPSSMLGLARGLGLTATSYKDENLIPLTLLRVNPRDSVVLSLDITNNAERASIVGRYTADGMVNFYLVDGEGLKSWQEKAQARLYAASIAQDRYNVTLSLERSGRYYVIFDNIDPDRPRNVVFSLDQKVAVYSLSPIVEVIPQAVVIIGFIILLIGLRLGGKKSEGKHLKGA